MVVLVVVIAVVNDLNFLIAEVSFSYPLPPYSNLSPPTHNKMSSTPSPPHFRHFLHNPTSSPLLLLLLSFLLFKSLLLLLALLAPGPGYDTSTSLLHAPPSHPHPRNTTTLLVGNLLPKLLRWDAIYFSEIARRGYVYEQEWAFGWGFTRLLAAMASGMYGVTFFFPPSLSLLRKLK